MFPIDNLLKTFQGKKVLITGGLGFIGSNLALSLTALDAQVTVVDALIPESGANRFHHEGLSSARIYFEDARTCEWGPILRDQAYLFNLAGLTSHLDSMNIPSRDLEINVCAQLALLEACRKYNRDIKIVFASTRQIYGKPVYLPVDEKHSLYPVDINGIHKLTGEHYHRLYQNIHGIRTCVLRLTNTFGPRMRIRDARQGFIGLWIRLALEGSPFEVWDGAQKRDFNYIDDITNAFLRAAITPEADGQVFNLGGTEVISLQDLADLIVELVPGASYRLCSFPQDRKAIDIGDYYSDSRLAHNVLGWKPAADLRNSLRATFDFYKKHGSMYLNEKEKQAG